MDCQRYDEETYLGLFIPEHQRCRLSMILKTLGFPSVPLHGQMSQSARLGALSKFKSGGRSVLVATDVASR